MARDGDESVERCKSHREAFLQSSPTPFQTNVPIHDSVAVVPGVVGVARLRCGRIVQNAITPNLALNVFAITPPSAATTRTRDADSPPRAWRSAQATGERRLANMSNMYFVSLTVVSNTCLLTVRVA